MTVVCTACEGQGSHERTATPTEVDNGCELGVAYDECEVCKGRGVVFEDRWSDEEIAAQKESRGLTRQSDEEIETLLGVADHDSFDRQAEMGQGPPA